MTMSEPDLRPPPAYLHDPFVSVLLNTLLNHIDKGRARPLRVNNKTLPALFDYSSGNTDYYWSLIVDLADKYGIFLIDLARARPGVEVYEKARLVLQPDAESLLRDWLNRPRMEPYTVSWNRAVERNAPYFMADGAALLAKPIRRQGQTAEQVVDGFAQAAKILHEPMTLRTLSAKCFWADSKFLDSREDLVRRLLPTAATHLITRPLLIHIAMAETTEQVLFIENQDTFLQLLALQCCGSLCSNTTLVNSAGFRGASHRIRQRGATQFSHVQPYNDEQFQTFQQWWFNEGSLYIPCYFWGDLDFSGMAILAALTQSFANITAWQPGYKAMLSYHSRGLCHSAEASEKHRQIDPGAVHCIYTNTFLLPLLRSTKKFVDQEVVSMADLHFNE